jgi:hypothetical protein
MASTKLFCFRNAAIVPLFRIVQEMPDKARRAKEPPQ